jgi:hypothetical protein
LIDVKRVIGIESRTLRKHYTDELVLGAVKANSRMAENLYREAMGDGRHRDHLLAQDPARWKEATGLEPAAPTAYPTLIVRSMVQPPPHDINGRPIGRLVPVGPPMIEHIEEHR